MAATVVYLDGNPAKDDGTYNSTGGDKNGVCTGQQRRISIRVALDDGDDNTTGTITSRYRVNHVDGLPTGATATITNTYASGGSVALADMPSNIAYHFLTLVCDN